MRRSVIMILLTLFVIDQFYAQNTEVLTNTIILKMAKAKLSDEIIIDEINNSKVEFDLSSDSLEFLADQNVSREVIESMKNASGWEVPDTPPIITPVPIIVPAIGIPNNSNGINIIPDPVLQQDFAKPADSMAETNPETPTNQDPSTSSSDFPSQSSTLTVPTLTPVANTPADNYLVEVSTSSVNSISYINHLNVLVIFYGNQFNSIVQTIKRHDLKIRSLFEKEEQLMMAINLAQKNLTSMKNIRAEKFNSEITNLKNTLSKQREEHEQLQLYIRSYGENLSKELLDISKVKAQIIEANFNEVCKKIRESDPDPSISNTTERFKIPLQQFKGNLIVHTEPLETIPAFFQNEMLQIVDTINVYTKKALALISRDSVYKRQLDPLTEKLADYLSKSKDYQKLNKLDIDALKKQCASLTKERRNLAKEMERQSETLCDNLDSLKEIVIAASTERFLDAIENIKYSYQDKF